MTELSKKNRNKDTIIKKCNEDRINKKICIMKPVNIKQNTA